MRDINRFKTDGGSVTNEVRLSPKAIKALRTIIFGRHEDKSPTVREVHLILEDVQCDEEDREAILTLLGFHEEHK